MRETVRHWNPRTEEWETGSARTAPAPARPARQSKPGRPVSLSGLSAGAPLPASWRDTAYAPSSGFADMRTYVKPATMRTRRAPVSPWSDAATIP